MSPLKSAAVASALILMGGSAAWAQSAQGNLSSNSQSEWGQSSPGARITADTQQKIRQSLEQSGFKDIHVIPESFVVRAQAPDGSHIVMLLSPDEVSGVVMSNANRGMQGTGSQSMTGPYGAATGQYGSQAGMSGGQHGSPAGMSRELNTTQQQAQQELSRYGYTNLQDFTPMRGWVADASKNGEHVHVMLSDNGLVATFPGK